MSGRIGLFITSSYDRLLEESLSLPEDSELPEACL